MCAAKRTATSQGWRAYGGPEASQPSSAGETGASGRMRTGRAGRPGEGGPGTGESAPMGNFDVAGKNFEDFAGKMGV